MLSLYTVSSINITNKVLALFVATTMIVSFLPLSAHANVVNDGEHVYGCMDHEANNFNAAATVDDGTCEYDPEPVLGCMDNTAINYNPEATESDGNCEYETPEEDTEDPETMQFLIEKKLSGPYPETMTADQFTFLIEGITDPVTVSAGTDDYASTFVELPVGEFTITEVGPDGFVEADWTVQWSGAGCQNEGNAIGTTITIDESDLEKSNFGCRADNQYKPVDPGDDNSGRIAGVKYDFATSKLLSGWVIFLDGNDNQTLDSNEQTSTTNDDGEYWFEDLPPGIYSVCEVQREGWTQVTPDTDSGCYSIELGEDEKSEDNNFWNQADSQQSQCIVEGYKYDETGTPLSGWTIGLGGEFGIHSYESDSYEYSYDSMTDVTDQSGYYCIEEYRDSQNPQPGTNYHVGEVMMADWSFIEATVDGSTTTPASGDSFFDVWVDISLPAVGETAVVNFYNQKNDNGGGGGDDQCVIEGYKYDQQGEPLSGWTIGLEAAFGDASTTDPNGYLWDTITDTTSENGYYCIPEFRGNSDQVQIVIDYRVGELSQTNWEFLRVEVDSSAATGTTVGDSFFDVWTSVDLPAVDDTLRVDFYNQNTTPEQDTFIIEGYVWHDDNENSIWEGFDELEVEEEATPEDPLSGWTVMASNGVTTFSTTTDSDGYYYFEVPAGTWNITEEVMEGWDRISPEGGIHTVTVPTVPVLTESLADRIFALLIPTAYAAVVETVGFFNFGNNESTGGGGGGGGGGRSRGGGSSNGGSSDDTPEGEVLGEQVSVIPLGAADTGAGGAATIPQTANAFYMIAVAIMYAFRPTRKTK